jgi:hypothetical protein
MRNSFIFDPFARDGPNLMFAFLCYDFLWTLHDCVRGFIHNKNLESPNFIFAHNILQRIKSRMHHDFVQPNPEAVVNDVNSGCRKLCL